MPRSQGRGGGRLMNHFFRRRQHTRTSATAADRSKAQPRRLSPPARRRKLPARRSRRPQVEHLEDRTLLAVLPPADLVSWWRAENNVADFIGAHDGITEGTVGFAP